MDGTKVGDGNQDEIHDDPFYIMKRTQHTLNQSTLSADMMELCNDYNKFVEGEKLGDVNETLASFLPNCDINEAEMIQEVEKGLKSYEKGVDENYSLRSMLNGMHRT